MSVDIVVGLLTLLGLVYMAWVQRDVRRAEINASDAEAVGFSAEAVMHLTTSLMQTVENLAERDRMIVELRARVESLEERDRVKADRITELEAKVKALRESRIELSHERDVLRSELEALKKGVEIDVG